MGYTTATLQQIEDLQRQLDSIVNSMVDNGGNVIGMDGVNVAGSNGLTFSDYLNSISGGQDFLQRYTKAQNIVSSFAKQIQLSSRALQQLVEEHRANNESGVSGGGTSSDEMELIVPTGLTYDPSSQDAAGHDSDVKPSKIGSAHHNPLTEDGKHDSSVGPQRIGGNTPGKKQTSSSSAHDQAARAEAERIAAEQTRQAQERKAAEERARINRQRDQQSRSEAERIAAEQTRQAQERKAAQEAAARAAQEAKNRAARDAAARAAAEKAAQQQSQQAAARKAAEQAAQEARNRAARDAAARAAAERAAQQQAQQAAARKAAEQAAQAAKKPIVKPGVTTKPVPGKPVARLS